YFTASLNFFTISFEFLKGKIPSALIIEPKNLNGFDSAIVICNHINKFDGLVVNYATDFRKLKIMTAEFNNRSGFLGSMMRADGILPFKNSKEMVKKFSDAVKYYLNHKTSVLFFPEGSEWWCYKKPRPFMDGAFHFAAVNNVPVLPIFITFKDKENKKSELDVPDFIVNILPAIFPDKDKTKSENTRYLKEESYKAWCQKYKDFYGQDL
ncbi:MAG: 1-acyl-sn-glycerol-3-phosphate acyltransferase, partial [Treponema sp.]|nr:1-acyl-sn-glycerol-3-phosphate acyltransferase [Treponema sp.]